MSEEWCTFCGKRFASVAQLYEYKKRQEAQNAMSYYFRNATPIALCYGHTKEERAIVPDAFYNAFADGKLDP